MIVLHEDSYKEQGRVSARDTLSTTILYVSTISHKSVLIPPFPDRANMAMMVNTLLGMLVVFPAIAGATTTDTLLSEGKPVTASPHYGTWPASTAVQSITSLGTQCTWSNAGSVALQPGSNKFWQVDLEADHVVTKVDIRGFNLAGYSNDVQVFRTILSRPVTLSLPLPQR
jgi:hypothetical protein